jgi:hypothetical protein
VVTSIRIWANQPAEAGFVCVARTFMCRAVSETHILNLLIYRVRSLCGEPLSHRQGIT